MFDYVFLFASLETVSDSVDDLMSRLSSSTALKSHPEEWTITSVFGMSNWNDARLESNLIAMHRAIADGKPSKVDGTYFFAFLILFSYQAG